MFRLMLNAHPRILIPGETYFLTDLMNEVPLSGTLSAAQVESVLETILGHWRWREWGIEDDDLRHALRQVDAPTLAGLIAALFELPLQASGKKRWGDKTPGYTTEIERLHSVLPNAQFLHVIRDGRDVCLSLRKTGWQGDSSWQIARYWGSAVGAACTVGRTLPRDLYLEVSYEALVLDTERELRRVCEYLGESFAAEMLSFHETAEGNIPERALGHMSKTFRAPRDSDIGRWKREMNSWHRAVFEAFAGPTLEVAGYERSVHRGLSVVRGVCRGLDWMAHTTLPLRRRANLHFPRLRKAL